MSEEFGFMDVEVDDAVDLGTVENGWTGELQISSVIPNAEKGYATVMLDIPGEEFTKRVRHMLWYPKPEDDKERVNNSKNKIKKFFQAFDINGEERKDPSSWVGRTAKAILKLKGSEQYGDSNEVTVFL